MARYASGMREADAAGSQRVKLFIGYDPREAIGFHCFLNSVIEQSSARIEALPLDSKGLPQGSNTFTTSRFLVPWLCGFEGHAIFVDGCDMLAQADLAELDALFDPQYAVQVVKREDYESRHDRKYIGTLMECPQTNYHRKNWASVMLINCEHFKWAAFNPESIAGTNVLDLLQLNAFRDEEIGALPNEWNRLVDEYDDPAGAKILHWSNGVPAFAHYQTAPAADRWFAGLYKMLNPE